MATGPDQPKSRFAEAAGFGFMVWLGWGLMVWLLNLSFDEFEALDIRLSWKSRALRAVVDPRDFWCWLVTAFAVALPIRISLEKDSDRRESMLRRAHIGFVMILGLLTLAIAWSFPFVRY